MERVQGISFEDMLRDMTQLAATLKRLNYATLQGRRWTRDTGNPAANTHQRTLRQMATAAREELEMDITVFNSKVETYTVVLEQDSNTYKWSLNFYD